MFNQELSEAKINKHVYVLKTFLLNILFIALYFTISHLCLKFSTINSSVSPIWPSTGLAIALLIIFGKQYIFSILVGAFLTNIQLPGPLLSALTIAIGKSLEAYLGFTLYSYLEKKKKYLDHLSDLTLITTTSLIAPLVSATVGVFSLLVFNLIKINLALNIWLTWWIADAMGGMIIIPLLLAIRDDIKKINGHELKKLRIKLLTQIFISGCILFLFYKILTLENSLKYIFFIFPFFVVLTFFKNKTVLYLFGFLISVCSIMLTVNDLGPFIVSTRNQNLLNLEIYLFTVAIIILVIAGLCNLKTLNKVRLILLGGFIFWGSIFYLLQSKHEQLDNIAFSKITNDFELRIKEKMRDYSQVLMSGRALYMVSEKVTPSKWKLFVESLDLAKTYEGMNGIGAIFKVSKLEKKNFLNKAKKEIDPFFSIKEVPNQLAVNASNASSSYIITYIEPIEPNKAARGLDIGSELNRRTAAEKSLNTGSLTITDRIKLVQDSQSRFGFLAFLPVYKNNMSLKTTKEREKSFSHWIYAPFITQKFLDSVFLKANDQHFSFKLYDSNPLNEANKIYEFNHEPKSSKMKSITTQLTLGDKLFFAEWSRSSSYATSNDFLSTWIGLIGVVLVLIIILFFINVQSLEIKSKIWALRLNRDFQNSQKKIKEQEIKMIESRRLATLGEMAGSVSHEINNPLAIISGNNQHLKRIIAELDSDDQKNIILNHVEKIEKTVKRITNIVKGLRLLSRDATNDQKDFTSFPILLEETIALCLEKFHHSKIDLKIESHFHDELYCRGTQISQVLINLLHNAHDAVEKLDEKWVKVEIKNENYVLIIRVIDSGNGIPEDLKEKILTPFFTTKEIGKGTGLGLSISKNIIEAHEGTISIETLDSHTCFTIKLPLVKKINAFSL